ncbi:uncharacterized protein VTP21DRAFT_10585 [Calcarisporiella thermophila]|uniref:uncharacterized protein n=1 Tax=Calcarisporiella thermophila TaxID=911321 RepID=UPI0037447A48
MNAFLILLILPSLLFVFSLAQSSYTSEDIYATNEWPTVASIPTQIATSATTETRSFVPTSSPATTTEYVAQSTSNPGPIRENKFPNPEYMKLLDFSLLFYEAQRSGKLPSNNRVPWRHDSGLEDGRDQNVDLVGGYYDAGNYMKFTFPLAFALTHIAWGALEYFEGYVLAKQSEHLKDMLKWGTDWLIKAHPTNTTLFVQVGTGTVDNNYWGPDTDIPKPRLSFKISIEARGTDVSASTAAAFAANSIVFRQLFNNEVYADTLLSHAKSLYAFAETLPFMAYSDSVPAAGNFYSSSTSYGDELAWGALWLYRATNDMVYAQKASAYFDQFKLAGLNLPLDWADQTGAVYVLGAQIDPSNPRYKKEAERYLDAKAKPNGGGCGRTKGGLLWCDGSSDSNSLQPPLNTAWLMVQYVNKVDSKKNDSYYGFVKSQWDYVMGKNPMNTPYIIGAHSNSPKNPHSALAHGYAGFAMMKNPVKYVVYGALVGGPGKDDWFSDDISNWKTNEIAIDYNVPLQNLLAYMVQTTSEPPYYANLTSSRPEGAPGGGPNWKLIAIVVACVLIALIVAISILYLMLRSQCRRRPQPKKEKAATKEGNV